MVVPVGEQVPLPIQATSLAAAASAVDTCSAGGRHHDAGARAVGGSLGDRHLGGQRETHGHDAVDERDEKNDDDGEFDRFCAVFVDADGATGLLASSVPLWTPPSVLFFRNAHPLERQQFAPFDCGLRRPDGT